mgnify:CR=1 FL=1
MIINGLNNLITTFIVFTILYAIFSEYIKPIFLVLTSASQAYLTSSEILTLESNSISLTNLNDLFCFVTTLSKLFLPVEIFNTKIL